MLVLISFLATLNFLIFLNLQKISKLVGIYDIPDKNLKLHKKKTPILGGIILSLNYLIIFLFQLFLSEKFLSIEADFFSLREKVSVLFLIFVFFLTGLFDDKYLLSPSKKLIFLSIIILVSLFLCKNLIIEEVSLSFYKNKIFLENFSIIFTIFCFLILINSLNFYDGINGQSCIMFIVILSFLFFKSNFDIFYFVSILLVIFLLSLNSFDKLFMGDSGIFLLSVIISISLIFEYNIKKNIVFSDEIFLLLILPGIDLVRLSFVRLLNGKNAFYGDRNHIHHMLLKKISLLQTNIFLFFLSIFPIFLYSFANIGFYLSLIFFLIIYFGIILKLK